MNMNVNAYRCTAYTKAGTRCKLHGPNGRCARHRLPSVDEELAAEREAANVEFKVTIGFIDTSYWDDGSRSTTRSFTFKGRRPAQDFIRQVLRDSLDGMQVDGRGGRLLIHPQRDDIRIERLSYEPLDLTKFLGSGI